MVRALARAQIILALNPTRFSMLQAAARANDLGNSDHGATVGDLPVKSSMEKQAPDKAKHLDFSSKAMIITLKTNWRSTIGAGDIPRLKCCKKGSLATSVASESPQPWLWLSNGSTMAGPPIHTSELPSN